MTRIHPTAVVHKGAEIDPSASVGPYSIIGPQVKIHAEVDVGPHAVITGDTTLQRGARVFQFASVGEAPQDLKYRGEPSRVIIGEKTTIREFCSVHRGTEGGRMETRVGARVLLMASTHVAHDCVVGDDCIIAGGTMLAGHVTMEERAIAGGLVGIHQFVRIGTQAFLAAGAIVVEDVMPYCFAQGDRASLRGLNLEGLKRQKMSDVQIDGIKEAYKILFREKRTLQDALSEMERRATTAEARRMLEFAKAHQRALMRP